MSIMASRPQPYEQWKFRIKDAILFLSIIAAGLMLLSVLRLCSINDHRAAQTSDIIPRRFRGRNEMSKRSCGGGRLTVWLSEKNQPITERRFNYGNTRHVSECKSCCACDWELMQDTLAADTLHEELLAVSSGITQQIFLQSDSFGHQVISSGDFQEIGSSRKQWLSDKEHLQQDAKGWNSRFSISREDTAMKWDPWFSSKLNGSAMPDCDVCQGCSHVLLPPLRYYYGFNFTFKALPQERQGMQTWRAYNSTSAASSFHSGRGYGHSPAPFLIKLWTCSGTAHSRKRQAANHKQCPGSAELQGLFARSHLFVQMADLLMSSYSPEGLLIDMHAKVAKTWIANISVVLPGEGIRVAGHVLASDVPVGVPAVRLLNHPWPWVPLQAVKRISSKSLLAAAVLDVLTLNCDRDLDDVFFDESGNFVLVNNEHVFGSTADGKRCLTSNSIFIPYSRNFKVAAHGLAYVSEITSNPRQAPHLAQLLDYRCHIGDEGRTSLGTDYPHDIKSFLEWVANMQTSDRSGFQAGSLAEDQRLATARLVARANDMLMNGFEWTILHAEHASGVAGTPQSNSNEGLPDMCCSIKVMSDGNVHCA